jgi:hypothetical protein
MTVYWFRPRRFGLGATPVTWQGWTLVLVYLAVVLGCAAMVVLPGPGQSPWNVAAAAIVFAVASAVAFRWSWLKTDGEWRWRWGGE